MTTSKKRGDREGRWGGWWIPLIAGVGFVLGLVLPRYFSTADGVRTTSETSTSARPGRIETLARSATPPSLPGPAKSAGDRDARRPRRGGRHVPAGLRRPARAVLDAPTFYPRPRDEWQGMRIDTSIQAYCDALDGCGLAMACRDNACGPCRADSDCPASEACVLDHCVRTENVRCRSMQDCGSGELCVLSGYSTDFRGNEDMISFCEASLGEAEDEVEMPDLLEEFAETAADPRPVSVADLRGSLAAETAPR